MVTVFEEVVAANPGVALKDLADGLASEFPERFPVIDPGCGPLGVPMLVPEPNRFIEPVPVLLAGLVLRPRLSETPSENVWFVPGLDAPFLYQLGLLLVTGAVPGPGPDYRSYVLLQRVAVARACVSREEDAARLEGVHAFMAARFADVLEAARVRGVFADVESL